MKTYCKIISLLLKVAIIVCVTWGIMLNAMNPFAYMSSHTIWMYFTVQSNLWVAVMSVLGIIVLGSRIQVGRWYGVVHLVTTIAITLTGLVYCFVLAPVRGEGAFCMSSILTHIVVPLVAVFDFFLCSPTYRFRLTDAFYPMIPIVVYVLFAALAYCMDWTFTNGLNYPYFFMNWGSETGAFGFSDNLPYMGVVYYYIFGFVATLILSCFYISLADTLRRS